MTLPVFSFSCSLPLTCAHALYVSCRGQITCLRVPVKRRRVEVEAGNSGYLNQSSPELQTSTTSSPVADIASNLGEGEQKTPQTSAPLAAPGIQSDGTPCQRATLPTYSPDNNQVPDSQDAFEPMLQLDSINAPSQEWQLWPLDPDSQLVKNWTEHHNDLALCGIQLVADTRQPEACVGVDPDLFSKHSHWAEVRSRTQLHISEAFVECPLRVAPGLLYKMIKSFYSGSLELSEDAEQMLRLANCLQVGSCCNLPLAALECSNSWKYANCQRDAATCLLSEKGLLSALSVWSCCT